MHLTPLAKRECGGLGRRQRESLALARVAAPIGPYVHPWSQQSQAPTNLSLNDRCKSLL